MTKFKSRVRCSSIEELKLFVTKEKKERIKKKKIVKVRRVKRSYSDWHRLLVVKLRYMDSNYDRIRLTWKEISEITSIR